MRQQKPVDDSNTRLFDAPQKWLDPINVCGW